LLWRSSRFLSGKNEKRKVKGSGRGCPLYTGAAAPVDGRLGGALQPARRELVPTLPSGLASEICFMEA